MKNKRISTIISVILLVTAVATLATVVFAWFAFGANESSEITVLSGDIDLNAKLYYGIDADKNGVLEPKNAGFNSIATPTRGEKLDYFFEEMPKDATQVHNDYFPGSYLTYKVIVENRITNVTKAKVSINFNNIESYFYSFLNGYLGNAGNLPTDATLADSFANNAARVMFQMSGLNVRRYGIGANDINNDFNNGYNKLVASSMPTEATGEVSMLAQLNNLTTVIPDEHTYNLLQTSRMEKFINELELDRGELLEVEFKLHCKQIQSVMADYTGYASNYMSECTNIIKAYNAANNIIASEADVAAAAQNYIKVMQEAELEYIIGDNLSGLDKPLRFNITKFYITGISVGAALGG